jgi:hypothetical protein
MSEMQSLLQQIHVRAAELKAHRELWRAIRLVAERSLLDYRSAPPAVRHVVKDRASYALVLTILRIWHQRPRAATAASFKKVLVRSGRGSKGRATDLIAYMQDRKLLLPSGKGRRTLLAPSAELLEYHRAGILSGMFALRVLGSAPAAEIPVSDAFVREYIMTAADLAEGISAAAGRWEPRTLSLFFDRDAGLPLLYALLEAIAGKRPAGEGTVSVSRLAARLGVSRPHILKMLVDSTDRGFLLWNRRRRTVRLTPELLTDIEGFFAGMLSVHELYLKRAGLRIAAPATAKRRRGGTPVM